MAGPCRWVFISDDLTQTTLHAAIIALHVVGMDRGMEGAALPMVCNVSSSVVLSDEAEGSLPLHHEGT